MALTIGPFQPSDQAAARALVLAGLVEHWGWLDETKNPDLLDISASYAAGCFLVARQDGRLAATGALLPTAEAHTWQVVRMSVAAGLRRAGLGRQMLEALQREARQRGARRLVLETTAAWQEVIAFYLRCGFHMIPAPQGAGEEETQGGAGGEMAPPFLKSGPGVYAGGFSARIYPRILLFPRLGAGAGCGAAVGWGWLRRQGFLTLRKPCETAPITPIHQEDDVYFEKTIDVRAG